MSQEVYDASQALCNDYIAPLFIYKFGSQELSIYPSSALEGQQSFAYVESQLYAAAVATEYEELRNKSIDIMGDNKTLTREIAAEYAQCLRDMQEKSVELDNWTMKYVEAMAKLDPGEFERLFVPELESFNQEKKTNITLSKLVNNLYHRINEELKTITVETSEEEDAKLYEPEEDKRLEGKHQERELSLDTSNTANGLQNVVGYSRNDLELAVPLV